ncbi:MAG TPA: hypothetical protein VLA89_00295 [Gemmatimonadales bacterium]|nr:hypothetical protein [Gemmatimonadales bacterium]
MALTELQVPYTGPYGLVGSGHKSKGPTAEALKRALSRMGAPTLPWTDFDAHYNGKLEAAFDWFDPGGQNGYGKGRWTKIRAARVPAGQTHAGEYALDFYARKLIQDEAGATSGSTDEAAFFKYFVEFMRAAIRNEAAWHYDQGRPFGLNINPLAGSIDSDCSAFGVQAADYARRKAGLMAQAQDPARQNWTGYGNTDLFEDDWPKVGAPFRIGDAAHFHSERHVIWCIKPGTIATAEWASNGREAAPELVTLATYSRFPSEYLYTVRPEYLP